jgi:hypothetical protein
MPLLELQMLVDTPDLVQNQCPLLIQTMEQPVVNNLERNSNIT